METQHLTPNDDHEPGQMGNPSHWGVDFGSALDLDGDTLVVGTQSEIHKDGWRTASGDGADWAYVFTRQADGTWVQDAKLIPSDAHEGDTFAYSVGVDEEAGIIVAGNPGVYEGTNKIYIFQRESDGKWVEEASFTRSNPWPAGPFGLHTAVSGYLVAAGNHPDLFLFEQVNGTWRETRVLEGGGMVAVQGDRLVTSVFNVSSGFNTFQLYDRIDGDWIAGARLDPEGLHNRSNTVGCNVALSEDGTTLAIGACIDRRIYGIHTQHNLEVNGPEPVGQNQVEFDSEQAVGSVWVYEEIDGNWVLTADIPNPDPGPRSDMFGRSVALEGDLLVVGAPWDLYNGASRGSGAAYIYEKQSGGWGLAAKLRNHDNGPYGEGDLFGQAVSISGTTIVVGAPFDDNRQDGTPWPVDDDADIPFCVHREIVWGCDEGEDAGSAYIFEPAATPGGIPNASPSTVDLG